MSLVPVEDGRGVGDGIKAGTRPHGQISWAMSSLVYVCLFLVVLGTATASVPLSDLFDALVKKQAEIKNKQLLDFIRKSVPQGIDPPNPKIAE